MRSPPTALLTDAAPPPSGDAFLAHHLLVLVLLKIMALTLLWALFFRAAP